MAVLHHGSEVGVPQDGRQRHGVAHDLAESSGERVPEFVEHELRFDLAPLGRSVLRRRAELRFSFRSTISFRC
jgi:hypothetical protein